MTHKRTIDGEVLHPELRRSSIWSDRLLWYGHGWNAVLVDQIPLEALGDGRSKLGGHHHIMLHRLSLRRYLIDTRLPNGDVIPNQQARRRMAQTRTAFARRQNHRLLAW